MAKLNFPKLEHRWLMNPSTVTERRREMNVRTPTETVRLFSKKYMDIDTGKYVTDKLETLYSESWADLIEPEHGEEYFKYPIIVHYRKRRKNDNIIPWFKPKDDDFDKPEQKIVIHSESPPRVFQEDVESSRREMEAKRIEAEAREKRLREIEEQEYQLKVKARELELEAEMMKARQQVLNRTQQKYENISRHDVIHGGYVSRNTWIPK